MYLEIKTNNGIIPISDFDLNKMVKPINKKIAKSNLLDINKILNHNNVSFGLMYGTLLGAIRENDFIEHDEDTDLFVLEENKIRLLDSLIDLVKAGFSIGRYDEKILTIYRNNHYVDFYFFKKKYFFIRYCSPGLSVKRNFLEKTIDYMFLGDSFKVSKDYNKLLENLYGENWRTPIKNDISMNHHNYIKFRNFIKSHFPYLFTLQVRIKSLLRRIQ